MALHIVVNGNFVGYWQSFKAKRIPNKGFFFFSEIYYFQKISNHQVLV